LHHVTLRGKGRKSSARSSSHDIDNDTRNFSDDGKTHQGTFDLSYLTLIPNLIVSAPKDENELRDMLYTSVHHTGGPIAVRYPRGNGVGVPLKTHFDAIPIGRGETLRQGRDIAVLAIGGLGFNLAPVKAHAQVLRIRWAKETTTICPYCAVGCSIIVHTAKDGSGKVINTEGDPDGPINQGALCAKGASLYQWQRKSAGWS
jgi:hypothetical protein